MKILLNQISALNNSSKPVISKSNPMVPQMPLPKVSFITILTDFISYISYRETRQARLRTVIRSQSPQTGKESGIGERKQEKKEELHFFVGIENGGFGKRSHQTEKCD